MVTPSELAAELRVPHRHVRQWPRRNHPRPAEAKWTRYEVTEGEAHARRPALAAQEGRGLERPPTCLLYIW